MIMLRRFLLVMISLLFVIRTTAAQAGTTYTVNVTADVNDGACTVGNCSLREAIIAANSNAGQDTIVLPAGTYTLTISGTGEDNSASGDLDIRGDLILQGAGSSSTIIDGSGQSDRVLHIDPAATGITVSLSGVTIQGANVTFYDGGGIYNRGHLSLSNVEVLSNRSNLTGGGVFNKGTLTLDNSSIRNNTAHVEGGGIENDTTGTLTIGNTTISGNKVESSAAGGIRNKGSLTLTNSTLSGNTAATTGAAIVSGGTANVNNVTIYNNQAGTQYTSASLYTGGVYVLSGTFNFQNTILAGNTDHNRPGVKADCLGTLNSLDYNVIGQTNCIFTGVTTHNVVGADPLLYPLAANGGFALTHTPRLTSPIIDAGNNATCAAVDQRGQTRPVNGNSDGTVVCDIGAVEVLDNFPLVLTKVNTNTPTADGTLVEGESLNVPVNLLILTFDHPVYDPAGDTASDDVTNSDNYKLVSAGNDGVFATPSCASGIGGDDVALTVDSVTYDDVTHTANLNINNMNALPVNHYRLIVCSSLHRTNGIALDGNNDFTAGDDFLRNFSVDVSQTGLLLTVNTNVDSQDTICGVQNCSLREAVIAANANPGSTITIPPGLYDLSLTGTGDDQSLTGDLDILTNMTLNGAGAASTTIRGEGDMVFDIRNITLVHIAAITVENGNNGIRIRDLASVTIADSAIKNNLGRGITIMGSTALPPRPQVTVKSSLLTGNHGGIDAYQAYVFVTNTTIADNDAGGSYGGGVNEGGGHVTLTNVTITGNHANEGGGVKTTGGGTVQNSIIYGNSGDVYGNNCRGSLASGGNNLIGSDLPNVCAFQALATDLVNIDPMLGPLQDNGGSTLTRALLIGSPAISAGNPGVPGTGGSTCLTTDQRGVARQEAGCDIGAYQSQYAPYVTKISAITTPYGGQLGENGLTDVPITQLLVTFSEPMQDPAGDSGVTDVTNPANYLLLSAGSDGLFQTDACTIPQGDDMQMSVDSVSYTKSTRLSTLNVNGSIVLPNDDYRLFVCHTLSDNDGNSLDGNLDSIAGDDFIRNFSIIPSQTGPNYTVTTTADEVDGVCGILHCSLREAVMAANAVPGANQIDLPAGIYILTRAGAGEDASVTGDLDILDDLTIVGAVGAEINANNLDRAIHIVGAWNVTLEQVRIFNGNAGAANGGAVLNSAGGHLTISNSRVDSNHAANGGGVYNIGGSTLTISGSWFASNVATTYDGGGVFNTSILTIDNSSFTGNNAGSGAAIMSRGSNASATITKSSLGHNVATADGGGIENDLSATLTIRNTTITSNHANRGGGVYHFSGMTTLNNVTISANRADSDGGGIYRSGSSVNISNTIIADNTDSSGGDAADCLGTLVSQDYNLIGTLSGCTLIGTINHNITGQSALLSGVTSQNETLEYHPILPGSPAIAAGNPAAHGSGAYACELTDERGVVRDDGDCDIGAYEEKYPIAAYSLNTIPDTGDGKLVAGEVAGVSVTQILVKYTKPAQDVAGDDDPDDVTNPANYRLLMPGNDNTFQTSVCGTLQGDDQAVVIDSVLYTDASRTAALNLNNGIGLANGHYRLIICGTTTIRGTSGVALDGNSDGLPGDDFVFDFSVFQLQTGPIIQVTKTQDVNDGYCTVDDCSLREAVIVANAHPNSTINLPAGTYLLALSGMGEDAALTGDLDVQVKMTINGADAGMTIIDGGGVDRVLQVGDSGNLTLNGITIQGGAPPQYADGGGILNTGTLSLINSRMQSNQTHSGSGGAIQNDGSLTITTSIITANLANDGAGGGIDNGGLLTVIDSTINNNIATNGVVGGGGIHNEGGTVTLQRVTLSGNQAVSGGGFDNRSSGGVATVLDSTISGNYAIYDGGGIANTFSAVSNLNNVTITANVADSDHDGTGQGGGLYSDIGNAAINIHNTLLSGNIDTGGQAPDCGGESINSQDYNLIGTLSGCIIGGTTAHNIVGYDPLLGTLQNNGGLTLTHALEDGSPAINSGDNNNCATVDQRGVSRPQQTVCDIGAFEYTGNNPIILPVVVAVGSYGDTGDGQLDDNETTNVDITQLTITFSQFMFDPVGTTNQFDVTNPANYRLFQSGADGIVQSNSCGAPLGDDQQIDINSVSWSAATYKVTLSVHSGSPLSFGLHRLLACGTLKSSTGTFLDGNGDGVNGDAFQRNFTLSPALNGHIFEVTTTADSNDGDCSAVHCSLRDAVIAANALPGSAIHLPAGTYTLSRAGTLEDSSMTGDLDILATMNIYGDGAATTIIDANGIDRVFDVPISGQYLYRTITIKGLNIRGGTANTGGGIYNASPYSTMTIRDSTITNNTATGNLQSTFRSSGGGIANVGTMSITNSVIANNTATYGPVGGGIANLQGTLTIDNSTISENSPGGISGDRSTSQGGYGTLRIQRTTVNNNYGGGIDIDKNQATIINTTVSGNTGNGIAEGNNAAGWLILNNVTITANTGVGLIKSAPFANMTVTNTLIYGNGEADCDANPSFSALTLVNQDYNLVGVPGVRCEISGNHNIIGQDPLLGALQNNGGLTQTQALSDNSPAIDAGNIATCETTDQRGNPRPENLSCDIGAYEASMGFVDLSVTSVAPLVSVETDTDTPYRFSVINDGTVNANNVTLTISLPNSAVFVSVSTTQGTCHIEMESAQCDLGIVTKDTSASVDVSVRYSSAGYLGLVANLASDEIDLNAGNNTAIAMTQVVLKSDLSESPALNYYTTSEITLSWSRISWAQRYEVEIAATPDFENPLFSGGTEDAQTLFINWSPPSDGIYYWHVRAVGLSGSGSWSPPVQIVVQSSS